VDSFGTTYLFVLVFAILVAIVLLVISYRKSSKAPFFRVALALYICGMMVARTPDRILKGLSGVLGAWAILCVIFGIASYFRRRRSSTTETMSEKSALDDSPDKPSEHRTA
jgi:hypothetical protein